MVVAHPKTAEQLDREARIVADFIQHTQVDQRRDLFIAIANELQSRSQGYTAGLFHKVAAHS